MVTRLVNWIASFRRVDGIQLPPDGRSSVESIPGQFTQSAIGSVLFPFPHGTLRALKCLWLQNPDLSQYVANIVHLGNTGHKLTIDAASDSVAEAALNRINEAASRIYQNGAGVDGLINAYLAQIAVFGALSSEDVVNFAGRRVDQTVLVPVEQIRFRFIDGNYVPHQQPLNLFGFQKSQAQGGVLGLIPLNPETYKYYAVQTVENSPYARPPAIAALDMIEGPQKDSIDNIKWIVQKLGILGLVIVNLTKPPRKPGEEDAQYHVRAGKYLSAVKEVLSGNFKNGLLVLFNDQKVDHANVVSDARGSSEIFRVIEEQVMSGLAMQPAFFGRTDSTTETYADVVYSLLVAQVLNMQRLAKRRQEQTYKLDLRLAGIQVDDVSLAFNRTEARDEHRKAESEQIRQQMILEKAKTGIISPDEAAQELGYEAAFDPELINGVQPAVAGGAGANLWAKRSGFSAAFRFDRSSQRYRLVSSRIEIASEASVEAETLDNVLPLKKKAA